MLIIQKYQQRRATGKKAILHKRLFFAGICVSRHPALALAPGPGLQFVFISPSPKFLLARSLFYSLLESTSFPVCIFAFFQNCSRDEVVL